MGNNMKQSRTKKTTRAQLISFSYNADYIFVNIHLPAIWAPEKDLNGGLQANSQTLEDMKGSVEGDKYTIVGGEWNCDFNRVADPAKGPHQELSRCSDERRRARGEGGGGDAEVGQALRWPLGQPGLGEGVEDAVDPAYRCQRSGGAGGSRGLQHLQAPFGAMAHCPKQIEKGRDWQQLVVVRTCLYVESTLLTLDPRLAAQRSAYLSTAGLGGRFNHVSRSLARPPSAQ